MRAFLDRRRPHLLGEVTVVLLLVFVYDRIRDIAATRQAAALRDGQHVLAVEQWLHLDVERVANAAVAPHHVLTLAASWYYQLAHLSVTLLVLLWVYWRRPEGYRAARNALVAVNGVALLVFWALPVAPPRLLPGTGFVDLAVVSGAAEKSTAVSPDLYAAMPSLHIAWATWVALQVLACTRVRWARVAGVAHVVLTTVVVVVTANHFVLDVVAGACLAVLMVRAAGWRERRAVGFEHVPAPRGGGRPADREPAGVGLARQRPRGELGPQR